MAQDGLDCLRHSTYLRYPSEEFRYKKATYVWVRMHVREEVGGCRGDVYIHRYNLDGTLHLR